METNTIHFGARRLQLILQNEVAECGLACLAMIATYHGFRTDLATLRGRFSVSLNGASFQTLIEYADRIKLSARPVQLVGAGRGGAASWRAFAAMAAADHAINMQQAAAISGGAAAAEGGAFFDWLFGSGGSGGGGGGFASSAPEPVSAGHEQFDRQLVTASGAAAGAATGGFLIGVAEDAALGAVAIDTASVIGLGVAAVVGYGVYELLAADHAGTL